MNMLALINLFLLIFPGTAWSRGPEWTHIRFDESFMEQGLYPEEKAELKEVDRFIGVRTWRSTGQADWNHTDTNNPQLAGDPTSELTYKDIDAWIFEINDKVTFTNLFFIKGNIGVGTIGDGTLVDDDYLSQNAADFLGGPTRLSRTESVIDGDNLFYITLDIGREVARLGKRGSLSLFVGIQYWRERYQAFGVNVLEDPYPPPIGWGGTGQIIPNNILVISNEVDWKSLRLGAAATLEIGDRFDLSADAAFIPYTRMHNEDTHHLRPDLAKPGAIMDGNGHGFQGELIFNYNIPPNWTVFRDFLIPSNLTVSLGFRYWTLMSDGDLVARFADGTKTTVPLNDLDTRRYGAMAGIQYRFD